MGTRREIRYPCAESTTSDTWGSCILIGDPLPPLGGVEPHLTLAFALRSTPGGYALLLGAGISIGSGVPSAWVVQDRLIRELAGMRGEDPGADAFAWYSRVYGKQASYDGLLAALTHSQTERQALLRRFFESDEQEREQGLKDRLPPTGPLPD